MSVSLIPPIYRVMLSKLWGQVLTINFASRHVSGSVGPSSVVTETGKTEFGCWTASLPVVAGVFSHGC